MMKLIQTACWAGLLSSANAVASRVGSQQKPLDIPRSHDPLDDTVGDFIQDVMNRWKIPGMSIAVVDGDHVYSKGYGYASLPDIKATPETLYFAGSTSKAHAATGLAIMIDSKNYSALADGWKTPISSIIRDDFVLYEAWSTEHITLEDAASHRTGMPRHDLAWAGFHEDGTSYTTTELVRMMRHLKPVTAPRTNWEYCNLMYVVLGHVIEKLSGRWMGDVLRESIWEPLGMTATFGDTKDAVAAPEHLADGYYWDAKTEEFVEQRLDSTRESSGAGLVISSVADYVKWARCLLDQTAPLSSATHAEIRKTRMLTGTTENGKMGDGDMTYGLAWFKKTYHGEVVYKHGGTELAYSTQLYWIPSRRFAVVAMANTGTANAAEDEVVWRIIEDKLNVPQDQRYNLTSSLEELMKEAQDSIAAAVDAYYPNRPKKPIQSSLTNAQIVGDYFDPGYGYLHIVEAEINGKTQLVADRSFMLSPYEMRFAHVTGNYWLVDLFLIDINSVVGCWAGEFRQGVDGEVAGVEIQLATPGEGAEAPVWFARV